MQFSNRMTKFAPIRTNNTNRYGRGKRTECCINGLPEIVGTLQDRGTGGRAASGGMRQMP